MRSIIIEALKKNLKMFFSSFLCLFVISFIAVKLPLFLQQFIDLYLNDVSDGRF